MITEPKTRTEEYQVSGDHLLPRIKALVHEGNVRHIVLKNVEGQTLVEIPMTLGVVGALLLPVWAALGAIAAVAADLTIVVVRDEDADGSRPEDVGARTNG